MHRYRLRLAVMIFIIVFFALAGNLPTARTQPALASQAAAQSGAPAHDKGNDTVKVAPDTPVITMDGYCDPTSVIGTREKPCRTVVSSSEFERLAEASGANTLAAKTQLAAVYVRFSVLAREAQKRGMEKDPLFQKKLELSRIQLLSQTLMQDLQAKSEEFSADDLRKFFHEHPNQFEQAALLRVHVPGTKYVTHPNRVQDPIPETAPEMKLVAEKLYSRAQAGEDFATIQKEAYEDANVHDEPAVDLGKMSRDGLRRSHQSVFDLKPGEISKLIEVPGEGYYIYKVLSKEIPPLEAVKSAVSTALQKQRMDSWMKNITDPVRTTLNEQYFGAAAAKNGPAQ
jgi:hypothetical protein